MDLGKGKKYSISGSPIDLGLTEQSAVKGGAQMPLRGETSEATQRPTSKTESMKTDRGTFKNKC